MTREEAISCVKQIRFRGYLRGANPFYEQDAEALEMAIKALSQEPTEKSMCDRNICISNEYNGIGCDECVVNKAEQEPCTDAVSRQTVLDGIEELKKSPWATDKRGNGFEYLITEALDVVKDLCVKQVPSVTQKSGKCKDCKWWRDSDGVYRRGVGAESKCPINNVSVNHGFGYCYMFEPQESEDNE